MESQADLTGNFDKHRGQVVKSLKCQWVGGKIPDPLPKETYGEPTGGLDNTKIKGCIGPSP